MILYHGSNQSIENIDLNCCNRYKDFGQAFYLSDNKEQAIDIAKTRAAFLGGEPTLNLFDFDDTIIASSNISFLKFDHYCLEWAQFVWDNRDEKREIPYHHDYDIVFGPIMNDTIGMQMRNYRNKHISLHEFLEGIRYSKGETFQYAFCTTKAIQHLRKI
ncbi:MAG: DUF3990 domain-containing protein [Bacteroidia bacterium]|nr:DUF3990 domain-containing protein [Bacteroidia bacterium]